MKISNVSLRILLLIISSCKAINFLRKDTSIIIIVSEDLFQHQGLAFPERENSTKYRGKICINKL